MSETSQSIAEENARLRESHDFMRTILACLLLRLGPQRLDLERLRVQLSPDFLILTHTVNGETIVALNNNP